MCQISGNVWLSDYFIWILSVNLRLSIHKNWTVWEKKSNTQSQNNETKTNRFLQKCKGSTIIMIMMVIRIFSTVSWCLIIHSVRRNDNNGEQSFYIFMLYLMLFDKSVSKHLDDRYVLQGRSCALIYSWCINILALVNFCLSVGDWPVYTAVPLGCIIIVTWLVYVMYTAEALTFFSNIMNYLKTHFEKLMEIVSIVIMVAAWLSSVLLWAVTIWSATSSHINGEQWYYIFMVYLMLLNTDTTLSNYVKQDSWPLIILCYDFIINGLALACCIVNTKSRGWSVDTIIPITFIALTWAAFLIVPVLLNVLHRFRICNNLKTCVWSQKQQQQSVDNGSESPCAEEEPLSNDCAETEV